MPDSGVVRVRAENIVIGQQDKSPLETGRYVKISVEDQGTGIPEEKLPRIFDPYFTTKEKGQGLGLAIAYSIVNNHGGYIFAESKVGVGTTISFYLPAFTPDETKGNGILSRAPLL